MACRITAYLMLILLLISSSARSSAARTFDKIIAYVNDDVVTKRELDVLVNQRAMELQQVYRFRRTGSTQRGRATKTRITGPTYQADAPFGSRINAEGYRQRCRN